ncbi:MAG: DUF4340 domain-containing protein [Thermoanaerobaculales bacterium]
MRNWVTILLAVVVLAFGAFIMLYERHQPTTDELKADEGKIFAGFDQAKVQHIVVTNPHGRFELKKQKDVWQLVAPLADDANQGAVTGLLSTLGSLKSDRTFEAKDVKLAEYGLDKPELSVNLDDGAGKSFALKLGGELPLGNDRAAMMRGDKVYLVSKWIANDIGKDLAGWRSDQLAQVYATDVASLTVAQAGKRVSLAHTGSLWTLTEPVADLADRERAEGVISDISGVRIKEFVDTPGKLADYGLEPAASEVTIVRRDANAAPVQLAFGKERDDKAGKQVACKRGERVYWVEAKAVAHVSAPVQEWRAAKLVQFDTWAVDKLEMEAGSSKAVLEHKDGLWKVGGSEVDSDAVGKRLTGLGDVQVLAFDRPKPAGTPLGKVKLTGEGVAVDATFYPGADDKEAIAVVVGRAGALAVDAAKVKAILADPAALAKPKPTPVPTAAAKPTVAAKPTPVKATK